MTIRARNRVVTMIGLAAALGCARHPSYPPPIPPINGDAKTLATLRYIDISPGTGKAAEPSKCYYVMYTGWLTNGTKFDSSRDTTREGKPRTPLAFVQGRRTVIPGWDVGFEGMKVGGTRRLIIPYQFAYGVLGSPPVIPPKSTLIFDVELMDVRDAPAATRPPEPPSRCPAY